MRFIMKFNGTKTHHNLKARPTVVTCISQTRPMWKATPKSLDC